MSRVKMNNFIKIKHLIHRAKDKEMSYLGGLSIRKIIRGNSFASDMVKYRSDISDYTMLMSSIKIGTRLLLVKV